MQVINYELEADVNHPQLSWNLIQLRISKINDVTLVLLLVILSTSLLIGINLSQQSDSNKLDCNQISRYYRKFNLKE